MERIETERDWFECEEPRLFRSPQFRLTDDRRYRFLALRWGLRIQRLFWEQSGHGLWFSAFEKWMREGNPFARIECDEPIFEPFIQWQEYAPDPFVNDLIYYISINRFARASICAGIAASLNHPRREPVKGQSPLKSKRKLKLRETVENQHREQYVSDREAFRLKVAREFCNEFRCVAGNPFRPVTFDPAWRTSSALEVAQTIDRDGKYDLLPILADVLEESGCSNADILNHCRNDKTHVKGCWVVDLAMGVIDSLHEKP